jgi:toxin ParE1/3/4
MKTIIIEPRASMEIDDAFHWYEAERAGLGVELRAALRETLNTISEHPSLYPLVRRDARRALLKRFPYAVFFREYPEVIAIFAFMHTHRDPRHWQSRL